MRHTPPMGGGGHEVSASLLQVLRRVTGDDRLAYDGAPVTLAGGFWAELMSFRLADPRRRLTRQGPAMTLEDR